MGRRAALTGSVLLDTHVLLWWQAGGRRLSRVAARTIDRANPVLVSPLTCWELATLQRLGRIVLDRDASTWVHDLLADDQVAPASLTPAPSRSAPLRRRGPAPVGDSKKCDRAPAVEARSPDEPRAAGSGEVAPLRVDGSA